MFNRRFERLNKVNLKLVICGHHEPEGFKEKIKKYSDIIYLGPLTYDDVCAIQKEAECAVNPRPTDVLIDEVRQDAIIQDSSHDFGKNVIPKMLRESKRVFVYDFSQNEYTGMTESERGYWRDVGSIDSYWQANMDLLDYQPELNLYSTDWPLRTYNYNFPPAKFIWHENDRVGMATNSMVSEGCVISGGCISRCVLSPHVRINSFSNVTDSILMENVNVGRYSEIHKAIIDKNVNIPPYTRIGVDREEDLSRGFYVSEGGVTVVPKNAHL